MHPSIISKTANRLLRILAAGLILCTLAPFPLSALEKKEYRIAIVLDAQRPYAVTLRDTVKTTIDSAMKTAGAKAVYTEYFTALDTAKAESIRKEIEATSPDLCLMINSPNIFADLYITKKLTDPKFRFISENAAALASGIVKTMAKPGGNVTGVGVIIQQRSIIRLMKMINPKIKRLGYVSWDSVSLLNQWFEQEIQEACRLEGVELVEFRKVPHDEAQLAFVADLDKLGKDTFAMVGVSAWVHPDGTAADMVKEENELISNRLKNVALLSYDENAVKAGYLGATAVVWEDIGLQLAEKALLVLNGKNPGDIPFDYPRKYNIMLNLATAKILGITIPQDVINAAYRVYTDFKGTYVQGK